MKCRAFFNFQSCFQTDERTTDDGRRTNGRRRYRRRRRRLAKHERKRRRTRRVVVVVVVHSFEKTKWIFFNFSIGCEMHAVDRVPRTSSRDGHPRLSRGRARRKSSRKRNSRRTDGRTGVRAASSMSHLVEKQTRQCVWWTPNVRLLAPIRMRRVHRSID